VRQGRGKIEKRRGRVTGIGTDVVEIARVARSLERTRGFAESIFSDEERSYCVGRARPAEHYAARFAAKEAFLKAVGHGIPEGIPLNQIDVGPAAARALEESGAQDALVSLRHSGGTAAAFVLVQR
jgi:holo-[acyl-carrier protein] synthase